MLKIKYVAILSFSIATLKFPLPFLFRKFSKKSVSIMCGTLIRNFLSVRFFFSFLLTSLYDAITGCVSLSLRLHILKQTTISYEKKAEMTYNFQYRQSFIVINFQLTNELTHM